MAKFWETYLKPILVWLEHGRVLWDLLGLTDWRDAVVRWLGAAVSATPFTGIPGWAVIPIASFVYLCLSGAQYLRSKNRPKDANITPSRNISLIAVIIAVVSIALLVGSWWLRNGDNIKWCFEERDDPCSIFVPLSSDDDLIVQFVGKNVDRDIHKILTYIIADNPQRNLQMYLKIDNEWVYPSNSLGIPSHAAFIAGCWFADQAQYKGSCWGKAMSGDEFLSLIGSFTFYFQYDDKTYSRHFSTADIEAQIKLMKDTESSNVMKRVGY
jgi:hypothetical protein